MIRRSAPKTAAFQGRGSAVRDRSPSIGSAGRHRHGCADRSGIGSEKILQLVQRLFDLPTDAIE